MLTRSQQKTYDFIKKFMNAHAYAPTTGEIAAGIGIKSRGVVHRYLRALEQAGFIQLTAKRHRNIQLTDEVSSNAYSNLPLVGTIAAGRPIEAIQDDETINVANIFLGEDRYALRVKGNSMVGEGILDGDIVVCKKCSYADDGQIVVALIDHNEATLKRFYHGVNNMIKLEPANPTHASMAYAEDRVEIQGIYIGLLRLSS